MLLRNIALVFAGAGLGGVTRYGLALGLNPLWSAMPLGTWLANVLGCGLAGFVAGFLVLRVDLDPALRPLLITGFLGGLTTFSSFSLEIIDMLEQGRYLSVAGSTLAHLCGSLAAALVGLLLARSALS